MKTDDLPDLNEPPPSRDWSIVVERFENVRKGHLNWMAHVHQSEIKEGYYSIAWMLERGLIGSDGCRLLLTEKGTRFEQLLLTMRALERDDV